MASRLQQAAFLPCVLFGFADSLKTPTVTLNNGVKLPMLALGSGNVADTDVTLALKAGFEAIDTAANYPLSQSAVGKAVKGLPRESFWITTKVGGKDLLSIPAHEYKAVTKSMESDLQQLGLDYVDLMLLHYPPTEVLGDRCKAMSEQWRALEDFYKAKKARAIGVSNYCQADLECLSKTATVVPAVNQVLFHVGMGADPRGLKSYCDAKGIVVQAYSPLGAYKFNQFPPGKDNSLITGNFTNDIGKSYNKTGAQIALRWLIEHGVPLNTQSKSLKHLQQDVDIFKFNLTTKDKATLDAATKPAGEPNSQYGGIPLVKNCGAVNTDVVV